MNSLLYKFRFIIILVSLIFTNPISAQSWIAQNTGIQTQIYSIKTTDDNTVWAGASNGVFMRTTDGGMNWTSGAIPGAQSLYLLSVSAVDADTAYFIATNFSGGDTRIYKTSDSGTSWMLQYQNTSAGSFFNSIAFLDDTHGIAVGDPVNGSFLIVTTTNGGITWVETPAANIPPPLPGEFAGFGDGGGTVLAVEGQNNAWFGTAYGSSTTHPIRILRSTDQGQNWSVANTPLSTTGQYPGISTMAFRDPLNGFAGGQGGINNLIKTTDGGQNWELVSSLTAATLLTLVYVPNTAYSVLVATMYFDGSAFSQDGGVTWSNISSSPTLSALSFASPTVGWAASPQQTGQIFKFMGTLTTLTDQQAYELPKTFDLSQNYPNPFNPSTNIEFALPKASLVTLTIYNAVGEKIATLVSENLAAGSYKYQWDVRGLTSGVYFYRLEARDFRQTKKLLLLR